MAQSMPRSYADEWQSPKRAMDFQARLGNLVVGAVKYVFAPDIQVSSSAPNGVPGSLVVS